jgi:hypothetical protein
MEFFVFNEPMNNLVLDRLGKTEGCTGFLFPRASHPAIFEVIAAEARRRGLSKVAEGNNFELLALAR